MIAPRALVAYCRPATAPERGGFARWSLVVGAASRRRGELWRRVACCCCSYTEQQDENERERLHDWLP
jgi:hypothetical protein